MSDAPTDAPAVSVIIPVYNDARRLVRAIESVRAQTFRDWELIVVDDGSTDGTPAVAARYASADAAVRVLHVPHRGPAAARNAGIRAARGAWLAFLDSDDYCEPSRLARQIEVAARHPSVGAVSSFAHRVTADGRRLGLWQPGNLTIEHFRSDRERGVLLYFVHSSLLVRRDLMLQCGGYPEDYPLGEDSALVNLRLAPLTDMLTIPEPLVFKEVNASSLSHRVLQPVLDVDVVRLNLERRRMGLPELAWSEAERQLLGPPRSLRRLMRLRAGLADLWLGRGTAELASRNARGAAQVAGAFALAPAMAARETLARVRRLTSHV